MSWIYLSDAQTQAGVLASNLRLIWRAMAFHYPDYATAFSQNLSASLVPKKYEERKFSIL